MHPFKFLKRTSKTKSSTRSQSEPPGLLVTPDSADDPSAAASTSSRLTVSFVSPRDNTVTASESHPADAEVEATEDVPPKKSSTSTHADPLPEEQHLESGKSLATSTTDLRGPWNSVNTEGNVSKLDRSVQNTENAAVLVQAASSSTNALPTIEGMFDGIGKIKSIEKDISGIMQSSIVLMTALDEVAKLHPFIAVAVLAFKTVWTLEMKRRNNDKRIVSLHGEMKKMMEVLIQLKNVKDVKAEAPDGTTIEGRMQDVSKDAAKDIVDCANACDTYLKKSAVVKVLKKPIWEPKLLDFVGRFTTRHSEFSFALTIHTSLAIDSANVKLFDIGESQQQLAIKMESLLHSFKNLKTAEEIDIAKQVKAKGGADACLKSDKSLQELSKLDSSGPDISSASQGASSRQPQKITKLFSLKDLKDDLQTDPSLAMDKNMVIFTRKYEAQKDQIVKEVEQIVKREADRIIDEIKSGPHSKIRDPDIGEIWKDMGWRGSVKARHFVLTLRDHFQEKWGVNDFHRGSTQPLEKNEDEWVLEHLNVLRVQPVSEAFDDDASGFITIAEANAFTASQPIYWSLPHWIAFWAIGWHQSLAKYANQIRDVVEEMFAILPNILPGNINAVNAYLDAVHHTAIDLYSSINACDTALHSRFDRFLDAEEERLKNNLEAVKYNLDGTDTLLLVTGYGRIEQFLFPVLYLLFKRHFEIFRVCQHRVVHPNELEEASDTLLWAYDAVIQRVAELEVVFKQQKQDVKQQFETFAHGMFEYHHDQTLWDDTKLKNSNMLPEYPYFDARYDENINIHDVLSDPTSVDEPEIDFEAYDLPQDRVHFENVTGPLAEILGVWHGYAYDNDRFPVIGPLTMDLTPDTNPGHFIASGLSTVDIRLKIGITGECSQHADGQITLEFTRTFSLDEYSPQYYRGHFNLAAQEITGTWCIDEEYKDATKVFLFRRTAGALMYLRPSPAELLSSRPHALWKFALDAIQYQVRRDSWSLQYFLDRFTHRKRFISLYSQSRALGKPLDKAEEEELQRLRWRVDVADCRFYHSLASYQMRRTVYHAGYVCDNCSGPLSGARLICLICKIETFESTVDICDSPSCMNALITRDDLQKPHLPAHDLVKTRRQIHHPQLWQLIKTARDELKYSRKLLNGEDGTGALLDPEPGATSKRGNHQFICIGCKQPVTQPCWYCVNCTEPHFICIACDAKGVPVEDVPKIEDVPKVKPHIGAHDLVRCQDWVEEVDISVEDRLVALEGRFTKLEERFGKLEEHFVTLNTNLDTKMGKLEGTVEHLMSMKKGELS